MAPPIVDPRMLAKLAAFYPSAVTIQQITGTSRDAAGGEVTTWTNVSGLVSLPCAVGTISPTPDRAEIRTPAMTRVMTTRHISIAGAYPQITTRMRAVVGSTTYNILAVEPDSQGQTTRLRVEVVNL